jgi:hypothetical protein
MFAGPRQIDAKTSTEIRTRRSSVKSKIDGSNSALIIAIAYFWLLLSLPILAAWPPPIDFALLLVLPMTLRMVYRQLPRGVIILAVMWIAGVAVADLPMGYFGSIESLQALTRPVLIVAIISGVLAIDTKTLCSPEWLYTSFTCMIGIGTLLHAEAFQISGIDAAWKYAIGWPVTVLVLYVVHVKRGEHTWFVVAGVALAALSIVLGSRSLALITLVGVVFSANINFWRDVNWPRRLGRLAVVVLAIGVLLNIYGQAALAGSFGTQQQGKWQQQSSVFLGPLIGGRPESVVAFTAIEGRPLWGWGTKIELPSEVQVAAFRLMAENNISTSSSEVQYYFRQTGTYLHSQLPTEWAAHGVMAAAGLLGLLLLGWRSALNRKRRGGEYGGQFVILLLTNATWNVMFSPWGPGGASILGLTLAVAFVDESRSSQNE